VTTRQEDFPEYVDVAAGPAQIYDNNGAGLFATGDTLVVKIFSVQPELVEGW